VHAAGRAARALIEAAREQVAALVKARPQDVIFTSGGTEANALALNSAIEGAIAQDERITRLFVSAIEHDSALANGRALAERVPGLRLVLIPVSGDGVIDAKALRDMLREGGGRTLVVAMAANNETGAIQPIAEIVRLAREADGLLLVDAVQAAGKMAIDFSADYLTLSAHKLGGPQGVGALVARDGAPFVAATLGGGQERSRRAGTENVAGIAGFGAAAEAAGRDLGQMSGALRDRFERRLYETIPDARVFGETRLGNTSNFAIPGVTAETALMALDLDGVMVSSGAACSSGKIRTSHVLQAMGVADEIAACALRVSFGWNSTAADADAAVTSLVKLHQRVRPRIAA